MSLSSLLKRGFKCSPQFKRQLRFQATLQTGQPIHETRPHYINPGDLTFGISALEYFHRRQDLSQKLLPGSLLIIPSNVVKFASGSVFYAFQQNNNFYYLTGFNEPDSIMILEKPESENGEVRFHMVIPDKNPDVEKWEGFRTGVEGAINIFNADFAESNNVRNVDIVLESLLNKYNRVYYDFNKDKIQNNMFNNLIEDKLREKRSVVIKPIKNEIETMRSIKSNSELNVMLKAGKVSAKSVNQAIANTKSFKTEKGLCSFLEYKFLLNGCDKSAYIPVVASGSNALCIHYTRNDQMMNRDDMVLIDAAGSLGGYCADISRTWPVDGKFSGPQRDLYQAVLNVQKECITKCSVSQGFSINELHNLSIKLMTRELKNISGGYFAGVSSWEVMKYLYPHYIGHHLGLDVHDLPSFSKHKQLVKGNVITIEPGCYVPDDSRWPKQFRGLGVRIEDDVAVGDGNYVVLTRDTVKEAAEIEKLVEDGMPVETEEVADWSRI